MASFSFAAKKITGLKNQKEESLKTFISILSREAMDVLVSKAEDRAGTTFNAGFINESYENFNKTIKKEFDTNYRSISVESRNVIKAKILKSRQTTPSEIIERIHKKVYQIYEKEVPLLIASIKEHSKIIAAMEHQDEQEKFLDEEFFKNADLSKTNFCPFPFCFEEVDSTNKIEHIMEDHEIPLSTKLHFSNVSAAVKRTCNICKTSTKHMYHHLTRKHKLRKPNVDEFSSVASETHEAEPEVVEPPRKKQKSNKTKTTDVSSNEQIKYTKTTD